MHIRMGTNITEENGAIEMAQIYPGNINLNEICPAAIIIEPENLENMHHIEDIQDPEEGGNKIIIVGLFLIIVFLGILAFMYLFRFN